MEELINLLHTGGYSCTIANKGEIRTFTQRGVADIYDLLTQEPEFLKGASIADKVVALCLIAAVSFTLVSCDDDMDIQQSYPFTVEVMPVPNKVTKGQTVEIRCELKKEGDFANTLYTIRYFQFEGEGKLKMDNGITFLPNDRYLLENEKFRLYYTAEGEEAHNFIVVVEDNFGNSFELEFDFNNRNVKDDGLTIVPIGNFSPLLK